jgi:hypothetical protein
MALVFISHAHDDERLAERLSALLCNALTLPRNEFFLSSQAGRGVAPGTSVREEILKQIATAPALIVVVTPNSARSPWVWLEVGCRLGSAQASRPLFVVRSEEDLSLLQPVADLRAVRLDDEGQLQELVKAVSASLSLPAAEYLDYRPVAKELAEFARAYSPVDAGSGLPSSIPGRHAGPSTHRWLLASAVIALLSAVAFVYSWQSLNEASRRDEAAIANRNEVLVASISEYLRLNGELVTRDGTPIDDAMVLFSKAGYVEDEQSCRQRQDQKECTITRTDSHGRFSVDLTQIQVTNRDQKPVNVTVIRPSFPNYRTLLEVDVRAMGKTDPPKQIVWSAPGGEAKP